MALTYSEFDSTPQNLLFDLVAAITASTDWTKISPTTSVVTSSAGTAAGATVSSFTSTAAATSAGWGIGTSIRIGAAGAVDTEYRTITAISGTTINVAAMTFAHGSGTNFYWGNEVMKATTTRGADMILDLNDAAITTSYLNLNLAAWTSHTGTVGTNKAPRYLYWRSQTGARTDPLHVVVSAGKEHLYFSVEGPRVGETNPDSATLGSSRQYLVMADMVPYHASDTTPCVFLGGAMTGSSTSAFGNNSHLGQLSKTHAGTVGWNLCRLLSLAFPGSGASGGSGIDVTRQTAGDGNYYLSPYVCVSDADGYRGRLGNLFNAGTTNPIDTLSGPTPPVGAKVTYSGKIYKLLAVNRYGGSNTAWGVLGAANNTSTNPSESPVVAVLSP